MAEITIVLPTTGGDDDLPIASTTDPGKILNSDDYALFENVPVFVEHQRALKDGRTLQFTKNELQLVADRSNRRIEETGDFSPIVIGHTSSDPSAIKPPKIGWAGPFRIGWLSPAKDKYAILADFRIEKDKVGLLKEYPRRSAEIWAEERYEDMYLDPISLLGADTPWSDMGVLYSKENAGTEKVYYSIAPQAPSAYSGLPGPVKVGKTSKKEKYSAMDGNNNDLSNDQQEIAQTIVNAILESPEFKFIRQQMKGANSTLGQNNGAPALPGGPQKVETEPTAEPLEMEDEDGDGKTKYGAGAEESNDMSAVDEGATQYAAKEDEANKKEPKEKSEEDELDDDLEDDLEEDDEEPFVADKPSDDPLAGKGGDDDFSIDENADEGLFDSYGEDEDIAPGGRNIPLDDGLPGMGADGGLDDDLLARGPGGADDLTSVDEDFPTDDLYDDNDLYGNESDSDLYGDEGLDSIGLEEEGADMGKIQSLERQIAALSATVAQLKKGYDWTANKVVSQERYAKLADLRQHYVFDEQAERQKCRYNKMKTAEFEARCREIAETHRPVPNRISLPSGLVQNAPADFASRPGAVQYSKESDAGIEDEVMRLSDQYASKGISKSSEELRKEARENRSGKRCR